MFFLTVSNQLWHLSLQIACSGYIRNECLFGQFLALLGAWNQVYYDLKNLNLEFQKRFIKAPFLMCHNQLKLEVSMNFHIALDIFKTG
jgi:hypothetical protein